MRKKRLLYVIHFRTRQAEYNIVGQLSNIQGQGWAGWCVSHSVKSLLGLREPNTSWSFHSHLAYVITLASAYEASLSSRLISVN